jgi:arylamine N-acetyltransferase
VLVTLTDRFGIDLTDVGEHADVEARVNAVLDS